MVETYGKAPLWQKEFVSLKERFVINDFSKRRLGNAGIDVYVPKLNKMRLGVGVALAVLSSVIPFTAAPITVPLALRWALK